MIVHTDMHPQRTNTNIHPCSYDDDGMSLYVTYAVV